MFNHAQLCRYGRLLQMFLFDLLRNTIPTRLSLILYVMNVTTYNNDEWVFAILIVTNTTNYELLKHHNVWLDDYSILTYAF